MRRAYAIALLFAVAALGPARADEGDSVPESDPLPSSTLTDADFHVESRQFGLEREVEMFQWRLDAGSYSRVWNSATIDSAAFDAAHRNPPRLPVRNRQWWVESVTLDDRPLPLPLVRLLGRWQVLHPNFSRLPGNYSATFQPEGDGLATSFNPLDPQIGDVRITWHEFVLPPLAGKVELHDGQWRLSADAAAAPDAARPAVDIAAATRKPARKLGPWFIAIAAGALIGLWFLTRAITGGKN